MEPNLQKYSWFVIAGLILCIQFTWAETVTQQKETCKEFCPFNYEPICTFDGSEFVEYSNMCAFEVAKCQARNQANREPTRVPMEFCKKDTLPAGASPKMVKEDCEVACLALYDPVCASDGVKYVTYSNTCVLGVAQCKARNDGAVVPMSVSKDLCKTED